MNKATAAILVIGDEILSGRTEDANVAHIARALGSHGIELCEARVVADREADIVAALDALRGRYAYVFTTGGIGPTHDDITAESVAKAFGVELKENAEAIAQMLPFYNDPSELNAARRRMARLPEGATLIKNRVSGPPGFRLQNVFVMAGVPSIMQAMLEEALLTLPKGTPATSVTITSELPEGAFAFDLAELQKRYASISIGSYPSFGNSRPKSSLVARGANAQEVEAAARDIAAMVKRLGGTPRRA